MALDYEKLRVMAWKAVRASRLYLSEEDAEEVVQDSLIALWKQEKKLWDANLQPLINRIVHMKTIVVISRASYKRDKAQISVEHLCDRIDRCAATQDALAALSIEDPSDAIADHVDNERAIDEALQDSKCADVWRLQAEGHSYDEIAQMVGFKNRKAIDNFIQKDKALVRQERKQ